MQPYKLEIWHDHDVERPDENSIGRMVSFNNRHINFEDPEQWLADQTECEWCNGDGYGNESGIPGWEPPACQSCDGYGYTTAVHPDVLATLSYYEHGLSKWMVGPSTVPDYGNFDTVNVAGVIVWNGEDSEREWWGNLPEDERSKALDSIADEYTQWGNGDTYGFTLTTVDVCETCDTELEGRTVDSCGGFIGHSYLAQYIRDEVLKGENIDLSDVRIVGEYAHVVTESDLAYETVAS